jgi:hypothetical protein
MTAASEQKVVVYGGKTYAEAPAFDLLDYECKGCAFNRNDDCQATAEFVALAKLAFGSSCGGNETIYVEAS